MWWIKQPVFCSFVFNVAFVFCQTRPAIYIDNGFDQTAVDHVMTKTERVEMELEILNLLGLPKRPKRVRSSLKMSASRYLMEVYKKMMQEEDEDSNRVKRGTETDLTSAEFKQIEQSDLIMTFESTNSRHNHLRHRWGTQLWFNISKTPLAEDIIGAELRVFKNTTLAMSKYYPYTEYMIQMWQIIKTQNGEILKPITAINTTVDYLGWLEFNMTSCLRSWLTTVKSNHGIYLTATPLQKPGKEVKLEDVGVVVTNENEETRPFMVAFMRASVRMNSRRKREATTRIDASHFENMMKDTYKKTEPYGTWHTCHLYNLYISFKDLKWHDWIIAPEGFSAYYCSGECNFPLHSQMNATNHAIVQTLVHLMNPDRYPKPCCAPTKVKPISVLHFLDDFNVILKKYKNMMVKSCGCH